jgi:hypothetical protein
MHQVLMTLTPSVFIQYPVHEIFLFIINENRWQLSQFSAQEEILVIFNKRAHLGGVEGQESVWMVGHIDCDH